MDINMPKNMIIRSRYDAALITNHTLHGLINSKYGVTDPENYFFMIF